MIPTGGGRLNVYAFTRLMRETSCGSPCGFRRTHFSTSTTRGALLSFSARLTCGSRSSFRSIRARKHCLPHRWRQKSVGSSCRAPQKRPLVRRQEIAKSGVAREDLEDGVGADCLSIDGGILQPPADNVDRVVVPAAAYKYPRSEEHTSELQSRGHLVCRLLLEKKKR